MIIKKPYLTIGGNNQDRISGINQQIDDIDIGKIEE